MKLDLPAAKGHAQRTVRASLGADWREQIDPRGPTSAVIARGQMELSSSRERNTPNSALVRTGKRNANDIQLLAGVTAGESVVIEGAEQLKDGQRITVNQSTNRNE